jgi:pimeloyl-ACP methyl ester carboxylesterase
MSPLRFVETTALHLGYYELGEGPAVVLLHGFPYDIHAYSSVASALVAEGYRDVVSYMRGSGAG